MTTKATAEQQAVTIPPMNIQFVQIELVGDSPLISHAWSKKAKQEMLDKQMKRAKTAKEAKDPERDFQESLYYTEDGKYGFPATAFKNAAVDACSHVSDLTKVAARGSFHIIGDMVAIEGEPTMREDMVRIGMGTADIRYRGEYRTWKAKLQIRYNASMLSAEQIVNLFNTAGFAIGVGEWRPQRDGSYGMFHVA
jgi:hypothetical protein